MIIVTRPSPYGEELTQLCHQAKIDARHLPFFNIVKGCDFDELQTYLNQLTNGDIVIIVSPQVTHMLQFEPSEIVFPDGVHYFAVGYKTASQLQNIINQEVGYPKQAENSEGLLAYLASCKLEVNQHQVLILSGGIGRTVIQNSLSTQGAFVKTIHCYQRQVINYQTSQLLDNLHDVFVVTSVEHLLQLERYCTPQHKAQCCLIVSSLRILEHAKQLNWHHIKLAENANNQNLFKTIASLCHNASIIDK